MAGAIAPAILLCGLDLRLRTHGQCETRSELRLRPHLFVIGSGQFGGQFFPIELDFIAILAVRRTGRGLAVLLVEGPCFYWQTATQFHCPTAGHPSPIRP